MSRLITLRHGLSEWNAENRFTGWVDVDINAEGEAEARRAGELIANELDLEIDVVFTSLLTRAVRTADIALSVIGRTYLPVHRHWRLNERHYGALQGLNKAEMAAVHGDAQVHEWRRSYATQPPPLPREDPGHPIHDPRYRLIPAEALPGTECLADVVRRMIPYYEDAIAPALLSGQTVLVVAHGNSLRALAKQLEGISDEDIAGVEIPTGIPRLYELDEQLGVKEARYLER